MLKEKYGIFGGTFDPPHLGHLILAQEACAQLNLKHLLFVLTPVPPHKLDQPITDSAHRLAMLELAISDNPAFEVSRVELDRPGPHYTADTLRLLAGHFPTVNLVFLMGGDSLRDLPTWRFAADLVNACHEIGVMRRPGDAIDLSALEEDIPGLQTKLRYVDAPLLEIASSQIRRRIQQGKPFRYYLSPPVYKYILQNRLYR